MGDTGADVRWFARVDDEIQASFDELELALLRLVPNLLSSVGEPGVDPAAIRLRPEVHPDDSSRSAEFRRLAADEIAGGRATDLSSFVDSLDRVASGVALSLDEADSWLRALVHARLILGARLGIGKSGWQDGQEVVDPRLGLLHLLGYFEQDLVTALSAKL